MRRNLLFFIFVIYVMHCHGQKTHTVRTVVFYNVENLFDTENDSLTFDDDRTPDGKDTWTRDRYEDKLHHLAKVLSLIGADVSGTSPDIIGLCEVENKNVLEDLIHDPKLLQGNYGIVHFDSPDERGIDVALLYKKSVFVPTDFRSHRLLLMDLDGYRNYTRDQLVVGGLLNNERLYLIVNHWPSRSGGEARSQPNRISAAKLNRHIIDSLFRQDADAKIISMGDLNDDPMDVSLKKILKTKGERNNLLPNEIFNPMEKLFRRGAGSLAYRDTWNLFDQILMTANLLSDKENGIYFWRAGIYNPPFLVTQRGPYKGYPYRTYAGGNYAGGFSDHFPVYVHLLSKLD